jgi:hypothetical protein
MTEKEKQVFLSSVKIRSIPEPPELTAFHNQLLTEANAISDEDHLAWINENRKKHGVPLLTSLSELKNK